MPGAPVTACLRCRQKKKRCDQKLPKCRLCELAGVECLGYDAVTRRKVPRSYISSLEQQVAYLKAKLEEQSQNGHAQTPVSESSRDPERSSAAAEEHSVHATASHGSIAAAPTQSRPSRELLLPRILLTDLVDCQLPSQHGRLSGFLRELGGETISLPSRETAQVLITAYFQSVNVGMPLLHELTFDNKVNLLYSMPRAVNLVDTHNSPESRMAVFFVFEVFAIGLLSMQKQDPAAIPSWLADRYHTTALSALSEIGVPNTVQGVQALLLLGQYSYHHPTLRAVAKTISSALRLAVDLRLHEDHSAAGLDFFTLDTMRRTFWVAYAMDRNISMVLGVPSCLSDGVISAQFPSEIADQYITPNANPLSERRPLSGSKRVSLHLFRYRQIQSEIRTMLYERPIIQYMSMVLDEWQEQMRQRIEMWYHSVPATESLNDCDKRIIETFEVTYNSALFYLLRPSPNIPSPSGDQLVAMTHAAQNMITLYQQFFLQRVLTIYWQSVENISSAGTALMLAYAQSSRVRAAISFRRLESLSRTCSSVLWAMVEHFPAFRNKRDAFDETASRILSNLIGNAENEFPLQTVDVDGQDEQDAARMTANDTSSVIDGEDTLPLTEDLPFFTTSQRDFRQSGDPQYESDPHGGATPDGIRLADLDEGLSFLWQAIANPNGHFTSTWI
ncbi:hypothetical protein ASPZODRAFT_13449 [Penicilliopsis zonata CBS 506.65]|uniref:Zn(2)-C6 fungal-type domain-containing protein n=1 Tax=Penicilliopsis zonata CBS 506.65 TaxID=1073090 RepID=A0A1L9ST34_9EURO|nr:hypothetical protein ASPZODRAFT_13449 [Penicilliopsis zonata CBS 506.65]OJJ50365.1 hypothetical protein ASPZODRAFT_13449 [Penicilliopsis zonata CBS 506.65]